MALTTTTTQKFHVVQASVDVLEQTINPGYVYFVDVASGDKYIAYDDVANNGKRHYIAKGKFNNEIYVNQEPVKGTGEGQIENPVKNALYIWKKTNTVGAAYIWDGTNFIKIAGGGDSAVLAKTVTKTDATLPTTRPDGTALQNGDYIVSGNGSQYPFDVTTSTGTITFYSAGEKATYYGSTTGWVKDPMGIAGVVVGTTPQPMDGTNRAVITPSTEFTTGMTSDDILVSARAVWDKIDGMDQAQVGGDGKYVKTTKQEDGKVTATEGTFDTTISSESTDATAPTSKAVWDLVDSLDTASDVKIAVDNSNVIELYGVKEENGVISQGTKIIDLAKVAKTGKAEDVEVVDTKGLFEKGNVEDVLAEIAGKIPTVAADGTFLSVAKTTDPLTYTVSANTESDLGTTAAATKLPTAKAAKDYVDAEIQKLDSSAVVAVNNNNVVTIYNVKEEDGKIAQDTAAATLEEVAMTGAAADVSFAKGTTGLTSDTVQDAIVEVYGKSKVTATTTQGGSTDAYLRKYTLTQNDTNIVEIDIPKDFLVKAGGVYEVTAADKAEGGKFYNNDNFAVGDKYIDLTINVKEGTAQDEHLYINVKSLVDAYTGGTTAMITVAIDSNNKITATINDASVTEAKLHTDVQTKLAHAESALQTVSATGDDYITASFGTKTGDDGAKTQALTVEADVLTTKAALASVTETGHLVDAKATKDYVDGLLADLDGAATIATVTEGGVVTIKGGVKETDGVIANDTAMADVTLAKVATTGAAVDVSITDAGTLITATDVEGALQEIAGKLISSITGDDYVKATTENHATTLATQVETNLTTSTSDKKLPTAKAVVDYVNTLDVEEFAIASVSNNVVTIKGIQEADGKIAIGTKADNNVVLEEVAYTGKAVDVSFDKNASQQAAAFTATTAQAAIVEAAVFWETL